MILDKEITEVFSMLHDSFIEKIEIKDSLLRFTLCSEFLASKLNRDYSYFFLEFMNVCDLEYEDWSERNSKYQDLNSILDFACDLWFTNGDYENERIYLHGHGGNSPDETSCGGTISFKCDQYRITKEDGQMLSLEELKRAYKLYLKESD